MISVCKVSRNEESQIKDIIPNFTWNQLHTLRRSLILGCLLSMARPSSTQSKFLALCSLVSSLVLFTSLLLFWLLLEIPPDTEVFERGTISGFAAGLGGEAGGGIWERGCCGVVDVTAELALTTHLGRGLGLLWIPLDVWRKQIQKVGSHYTQIHTIYVTKYL